MNHPINSNNHQVGSTDSAQSSSASKGHCKASASDHAMYLGMMSLIEGISSSESTGVSLAEMSKTLYDTMVKNGANNIQDMQKQLSDLSYLQNNWAAFQAYAQWLQHPKGPAPQLPTNDPALIQKCVGYVDQYGTLSSYRAYVNGFSQQINTANNAVQSNKQIPDSLQDQVRLMVNDQSQYASEVSTFLQVMQDQLQFS